MPGTLPVEPGAGQSAGASVLTYLGGVDVATTAPHQPGSRTQPLWPPVPLVPGTTPVEPFGHRTGSHSRSFH